MRELFTNNNRMKIAKKINPAKPEETSEKVARQAFLIALAEMRALPPPTKNRILYML